MWIRDGLHILRIEEMLRQVLGMLEMTKNALNEENLELALNVFSKDIAGITGTKRW